MKLMIVDGVDLSGKSSAIDIILKENKTKDIHYKHFPPPPKGFNGNIREYWEGEIMELFNRPHSDDTVFICDRGILSSHIYGSFKQDQKYVSFTELIFLIDFCINIFSSLEIYLFHCSEKELMKRWGDRGEDYLKKHEIIEVQEEYKKLFAELIQLNHAGVKIRIMPENVRREHITKYIKL